MKIFTTTIIALLLLTSCTNNDTVKKEAEAKEKVETDNELTKNNVFEKVELLLEKKIEFKDLSITYDDLLSKFSKPFRAKFLKDGGDVLKSLMPEWSAETEEMLSNLDAGKNVTFIDTQLKLEKEDAELSGYQGRVMFELKGKQTNLDINALELNGVFYILSITNF